MKFDHIIACNGETAEDLVLMLSKQMRACDLALTPDRRETREQQLMGMQKALREILPGNYYREIVRQAEAEANW